MTLPIKHFYMIRHGQTEANAAQVMAGHTDSPLTELGREQARRNHAILGSLKIKPKHIVHSHLSRARDTANILNQVLNLPTSEDSDLSEWNVGEWEGVPWADCPAFHEDWGDPEGGEAAHEFIERVKRGKNKALSLKDTPAMIVCHGGVFRAFCKLYGIESPGVRNCHLYEFVPKENLRGGTSLHENLPWDVFHYDLCKEGNVHRMPARISFKEDMHPHSVLGK